MFTIQRKPTLTNARFNLSDKEVVELKSKIIKNYYYLQSQNSNNYLKKVTSHFYLLSKKSIIIYLLSFVDAGGKMPSYLTLEQFDLNTKEKFVK